MKFYVDEKGVIRHNPKGWPKVPPVQWSPNKDMIMVRNYEQALECAKAESVPVKDQKSVHITISECNQMFDVIELIHDEFYEVHESEIKPEWL